METSKIDFVTYGHTPKWLNGKRPKLHIVKHELNDAFSVLFPEKSLFEKQENVFCSIICDRL